MQMAAGTDPSFMPNLQPHSSDLEYTDEERVFSDQLEEKHENDLGRFSFFGADRLHHSDLSSDEHGPLDHSVPKSEEGDDEEGVRSQHDHRSIHNNNLLMNSLRSSRRPRRESSGSLQKPKKSFFHTADFPENSSDEYDETDSHHDSSMIFCEDYQQQGEGGKVMRGRRASRTRRMSTNGEDLDDGSVTTYCPHCGKSYRQNNSLYKHLYEHHPFWTMVSKEFQMSKHQQVMVMQCAELLLSMKHPDAYGNIPIVRF